MLNFSKVDMMLYRITFIILLIVSFSFKVVAQTSEREYALKAGLIYNFALYSNNTLTSPEKVSNYTICSTSTTFVDIARKVLKNKRIRQHNVVIKDSSTSNIGSNECHIIFFDQPDLFSQYQNSHPTIASGIMLIGEIPNFIGLGGHINFIHLSGKVRFEINPDRLKESDIKISSKVIRLGKIKKANDL